VPGGAPVVIVDEGAPGGVPGGVPGGLVLVPRIIDELRYRGLGHDRFFLLTGTALLQAGCDVNASDSFGRTPLMYAVRYDQPTAVRLLLDAGADVSAKNKAGMTAMGLAKQINNQEVIQLLESAGAPQGAAKEPGASPAKPGE